MEKNLSMADKFEIYLELGWDFAIEQLDKITNNKDIKLLSKIYMLAYKTNDYKETADVDFGLCYEIRAFAIKKILETLKQL